MQVSTQNSNKREKAKNKKVTKENILSEFKNHLLGHDISLSEVNAGYDVYGNNILLWINTNSKEVEFVCKEIQHNLNLKMVSSGISIITTIIPDWQDLPLPSNYSPLR